MGFVTWHPKDTNHAQNKVNSSANVLLRTPKQIQLIIVQNNVNFFHTSYLSKDALSKLSHFILRHINTWTKQETEHRRTKKDKG